MSEKRIRRRLDVIIALLLIITAILLFPVLSAAAKPLSPAVSFVGVVGLLLPLLLLLVVPPFIWVARRGASE